MSFFFTIYTLFFVKKKSVGRTPVITGRHPVRQLPNNAGMPPSALHCSTAMSNFACGICGRTQVDKGSVGYVAGCSHHPPERRFWDTFVTVWFADSEKPTRAFYSGAWFKSEKAQEEGKAVHPVAWDAEHCHHGNIADECEKCRYAWQATYGGA